MDFLSARHLLSADEHPNETGYAMLFECDTESRRYVFDAATDTWKRADKQAPVPAESCAESSVKKRARSPAALQQTQALFDEETDDDSKPVPAPVPLTSDDDASLLLQTQAQ